MVLCHDLKHPVVGLAQLGVLLWTCIGKGGEGGGRKRGTRPFGGETHEQGLEGDGDEEFDEHVECFVQGIIPIQPEHTKVDVTATERLFQHVEAHRDPLQRRTNISVKESYVCTQVRRLAETECQLRSHFPGQRHLLKCPEYRGAHFSTVHLGYLRL